MMFRRVASDVFERTNGRQRPEISNSLLTDYFLSPTESDNIAWSRVRDSNDPADFKEFIRRFPTSPFARDAQNRIDLIDAFAAPTRRPRNTSVSQGRRDSRPIAPRAKKSPSQGRRRHRKESTAPRMRRKIARSTK